MCYGSSGIRHKVTLSTDGEKLFHCIKHKQYGSAEEETSELFNLIITTISYIVIIHFL